MKTRNTRTKLIATAIALVALAAIWTALSANPVHAVDNGPVNSQESTAAGKLQGTWIAHMNIEALGPVTHLFSFVKGGIVVQTDSIELIPPPGTNGQGVWAKTGDNEFAYTVIKFLFDEKGAPIGSAKIRGAITLNGKDAFSSVEDIELLDPDGNVFLSTSGTTQATRMMVELPTRRDSGVMNQTNPNDKSIAAKGWSSMIKSLPGKQQ